MRKLIIILTFVFFSCAHEPKTIPAAPTEINAPRDPSFVVARDTISTHGPHSITRNLLLDKNGNLWFASWEGVIRYDGKLFTNVTLKAGLRHFHVFSLLEDKTGNLWFGTIGGGVYRYDPSAESISQKAGLTTRSKSWTLFTTTDGLASNVVMCMLEDKAGNMWFGTNSGVSRYDGKAFTNFTMKDSLSGNF